VGPMHFPWRFATCVGEPQMVKRQNPSTSAALRWPRGEGERRNVAIEISGRRLSPSGHSGRVSAQPAVGNFRSNRWALDHPTTPQLGRRVHDRDPPKREFFKKKKAIHSLRAAPVAGPHIRIAVLRQRGLFKQIASGRRNAFRGWACHLKCGP
jgi:hypothetical protein